MYAKRIRVKDVLYREESQYARAKDDGRVPPHTEEFMECLQKALKIMETKYSIRIGRTENGSD